MEKSVENGIIIMNNSAFKELQSTLEYIQNIAEKLLDETITAKEVIGNANCVKPIKATSN